MNKLIPILLLIAIEASSQSPTFRALLSLNHNIDNNKFELTVNPAAEAFDQMKSTIWNNIYFRYFKNPNIRGSQKPDESMRFAIRTQFLYNLYYKTDTTISITINKGSKDKLANIHINVFTKKVDQIVKSKVKPKIVDVSRADSHINIKIAKGIIEPGSFVQILIETESYNFKQLGAFNFTKPISGNYDFIMTANIPEVFKYTFPGFLRPDVNRMESMHLKEFTYLNPPIVDYTATSYSYKWKIPEDHTNKKISFALESINLHKDFGTSVEELMRTSQ